MLTPMDIHNKEFKKGFRGYAEGGERIQGMPVIHSDTHRVDAASELGTFVVSEETGAISIAYKGNFIHDLSVQEFEQELSLILLKEQEPRQSFFQRWIGGSKK